jgi:phosphoribosylanthranilate isomerase
VTRVKICGITSPEDALAAADAGASAIGILFWPASPRFVERDRARAIVKALPPFVGAVGVFVNQLEEAAQIAREVGLSAVQFHGDEAPESYRAFPVPVIKAIAVRDESSIGDAVSLPADVTVLLDADDRAKRGGTGQVVDWTIAAAIARRRRTLLAGGLSPLNAGAAIAAVSPYAIDVSSGVESAPGRKDHAKIRDLFAALGRGSGPRDPRHVKGNE